MVLNRSVEYGFKGYQVPATPRAARSARRRSSFKRKVEDNKMFAFDLLATVAGKLLIGNDNSPTPPNLSTKNNQYTIADNGNRKDCQEEPYVQVEPEHCNKGSSGSGSMDSQLVLYDHDPNRSFKEIPDPVNGDNMSNADMNATLDCSQGLGADRLGIDKSKVEGNFASKVELGYPVKGESTGCRLEEETKNKEDLVIKKAPFSNDANTYHLGNAVVWNAKPLAQVSSESSAKVPFYENKDHLPHNTFPQVRDDVVVVSKDDDENSSGCTHPCSSRPSPCIGDRRIRKVLASKYCKASSNIKNEPASRTDVKLKSFYRDRKNFYKRQRSQRIYPFKKRKFFDVDSESNSDGGISGNGDPGDTPVNWPSSPAARQHSSSHRSSDSHVKLRIESFRVPELFIELPETATVGSLKRAVMEAVSAILGGELRVGVLLQGKKVGDDSKTLLQTGISHNNQRDALGFALEPISLKHPSSGNPGPPHILPPCDSPQHCSSKYPPIAAEVHQKSSEILPEVQGINIGNVVESDRDSATSPAAISHKAPAESKALIPVSATSAKALAVVPVHRKSKRCEMAQRRIRRPFSVAEVEALVQAVEKLGTGRWRDVKLRAFDSAKHRTYVDLKDKWKTLVHTARISPQQRRGEPVPQELLDRVLTAHAYWSQQQAKQQLKQPPDTPCLILS